MKLVLRYPQGERRLRFIRERLETDWTIQIMPDSRDLAALGEAVADADMLLSMDYSAEMPPAPRLKLLQLPGAGYDEVDFDAVPPGATVCNVFEHEIGIAEYLVLGMLEWEIRLCALHAGLRQGDWSGSFVTGSPLHGELFGKTVGFIGYGRIARETARRLRPFGVQVLACTRTPASGDEHVDDIRGMDALHGMLERCDYAIVSCPLTQQTRGIIDGPALDALGPGGVIMNVGRGPVIDEDALWQALSSNRIAGAVIDTWYQYPDAGEIVCFPSKHPIQTLENVILSPHASGWSAGLLDRRWSVITDNMNRLARGDSLRNQLAPRP